MLSEFHFIRPYWLLIIVPLLMLLWWRRHFAQHPGNWRKVCDSHLLPHLMVDTPSSRKRWSLWLLGFCWLLAAIAMSGPTWSKLPQPIYRSLNARVIVLDLSPDMLAADIKPSRLTRAKFKVLDILKRSQEAQVGLVVFSGEPFVVSPLTQDAATIANMVPVLTPMIMPTAGSNVAWALKQAEALFKQAGVKKGEVLLVTVNSGIAKALAQARQLHREGYTLSVLGIGTSQGAPIRLANGGFLKRADGAIQITHLDVAALKKLAQAGGGRYVAFTVNNQDVDQLLSEKTLATQTKKTKQTASVWKDQGRWLILFLLPFAMLGFRRGIF